MAEYSNQGMAFTLSDVMDRLEDWGYQLKPQHFGVKPHIFDPPYSERIYKRDLKENTLDIGHKRTYVKTHEGDRRHRSKVTPELIRQVKGMIAEGYMYKEISFKLGISDGFISKLRRMDPDSVVINN